MVWTTATPGIIPPGSASASANEGVVSLLARSEAGAIANGGSATAFNSSQFFNNATGSPINAHVALTVSADATIQHAFADGYIIRDKTNVITWFINVGAVNTGVYTANFIIPVGITEWEISFGTGSGSVGSSPFPAGQVTWDVAMTVL